MGCGLTLFFFFSSRRRHTRLQGDWSSDVCSSDLNSSGAEDLFYKQYNTPQQNNGIAHNLDDDSYGSFFGSVSFRDFSIEGAFIRREKDNPTAQYFTTFNDDRLRTIDQRSYATLKYARQFPDVVDVTAQLYYDRADF